MSPVLKISYFLPLIYTLLFVSCTSKGVIHSKKDLIDRDTSFWYETQYCFNDGNCTPYLKSHSKISKSLLGCGETNILTIHKKIYVEEYIEPADVSDVNLIRTQLEFLIMLFGLRTDSNFKPIDVNNSFNGFSDNKIRYKGNLKINGEEYFLESSINIPSDNHLDLDNIKFKVIENLTSQHVVLYNDSEFTWEIKIFESKDVPADFIFSFLKN